MKRSLAIFSFISTRERERQRLRRIKGGRERKREGGGERENANGYIGIAFHQMKYSLIIM